MAADTPVMTVATAADYLACSRAQVYQLISRGELPATRVGADLRVRRSDLDAYLDRQDTRSERNASTRR
jgi:excisionase family DNA binding protein